MVQDEPTVGLLIFLLVLGLPTLALVLPFFYGWYHGREEQINALLGKSLQGIQDFRQKRGTTYTGDSE